MCGAVQSAKEENMLHLITGTPGAGKTLYAVFLIDNYEKANQRALEYNAIALKKNSEENQLKSFNSAGRQLSKKAPLKTGALQSKGQRASAAAPRGCRPPPIARSA